MEVKLPNGRSTLSRAQAVVIRRIRDAEAIARVVTSVLDASNLLDEIDTAIDEQG